MSTVTIPRHLLGYAVRGIHEDLRERLAHIHKYETRNDLMILCQDYIVICNSYAQLSDEKICKKESNKTNQTQASERSDA